MTTRKRRTFDPNLKLEVVRMIKEQARPECAERQRKHEHRPERDPALAGTVQR